MGRKGQSMRTLGLKGRGNRVTKVQGEKVQSMGRVGLPPIAFMRISFVR